MSSPDIIAVISQPVTLVATIHNGPKGDTGPQGPVGPPIVDTGSYVSPTIISGAVTVPADGRARIYLKGNSAATTITSIGNGSGTQELYILTVDSSHAVILNSLSNVFLRGEWYGSNFSEICLHWINGASTWVEAGRNEI